ncbi:MAG: hypothetical protein AB7E80_02875 [Hyphomicrobiaceae bacterium]
MNRRSTVFLIAALALFAALAAGHRYEQGTDTGERCPGRRFAVETVTGGAAPYITLRADEQRGAFLLDYGATFSTLSSERFGNHPAGGTISRFDLPTFPAARFKLTSYWTQRAPPGGQLGVIGTDFLSLLTADFAYGRSGRSVVVGGEACSEDILKRRSLVPVRQTGFFSSNPVRLAPGRLNVPVVFLKFGPVTTWAQIDTGYDDIERRPSIDINEELYSKLAAAGITLTDAGTTQIATCAGTERRSVYRTPDVTVVTETGSVVRKLGPVHLVRKSSSSCGGIANLAEPGAQVAASLLAMLGEIVFDPHNERVWLAGGDGR